MVVQGVLIYLIDNYYLGEPALSFYIEDNNKRFLFDVGYSDIFIKNAKKMDIDLNNLDGIIISHGHDDHTRGLKYLSNNNINIYSNPLTFNKKIENNINIGSFYDKEELSNMFKLAGTVIVAGVVSAFIVANVLYWVRL